MSVRGKEPNPETGNSSAQDPLLLFAVTSVPWGPAEDGSRLGPKQALRMWQVEGQEGGACLGQSSGQSTEVPAEPAPRTWRV